MASSKMFNSQTGELVDCDNGACDSTLDNIAGVVIGTAVIFWAAKTTARVVLPASPKKNMYAWRAALAVLAIGAFRVWQGWKSDDE